MKIKLLILIVLLFTGFSCAAEFEDLKKEGPYVVQGEVIGVEFIQPKPGGCSPSVPAQTVVGLKTAENELKVITLNGIYPVIKVGEKYRFLYYLRPVSLGAKKLETELEEIKIVK